MNHFTTGIKTVWPALWIGTLIGVVWAFVAVFGPVASNKIRSLTYEVFPVVVMTGSLVRLDDSSVMIHIEGAKLRMCDYRSMEAYAQSRNGLLTDTVELLRVAGKDAGISKPLGAWNLGDWIIRPIDKHTSRVLVYVSHDCSGDIVKTKIADVAWDPA